MALSNDAEICGCNGVCKGDIVNAIGSKTTVLLILIGLLYQRVDMFIDIALAYAMLNFIAVLAASRFFQKRKGLYDETRTGGG